MVYHPSSTGDKLTLPEFVSNYHKSLPLPIRVCRGYCGPSEDTSISEGDHFNVHFIKHTTVVLVEMENGHQYNVPLNSAVPFGILFDPHKNLSQASKGYTYTKVSDILQLKELPNIVLARKAHTSSNPENSIAANELLLVRRAARKRIGKNQLKVYSLTEKREKTLSESCIGHFSTKPRDVCVYLPDIVKHAPDIFPCKAIIFPNKEGNVPSKLTSSAVTLMHHSIETSLVVTSALEEDTENARMLDIPIDLDIQVRVATTTELDSQKLARNTAYLYNHFNPSRLQSYVRSAQSRGMEETQNLLYRTVRVNNDRKGIKLTRPSILPDGEDSSQHDSEYKVDAIYEDIPPLREPHFKSPEPHYMSPRPAGTPVDDAPPLPERNTVPKRTPGYSYVEVDSVRCAPGRASRAARPVAVKVGPGDQASGNSSFGSTGSGGAVVERTISEMAGGYRFGGSGDPEFSNRSSYSEGDLEVVRRRGLDSGGCVAKPEEVDSVQEHELDMCLLGLRDMAQDLDMALQEGQQREAEKEAYSHLHHNGPRQQQRPGYVHGYCLFFIVCALWELVFKLIAFPISVD